MRATRRALALSFLTVSVGISFPVAARSEAGLSATTQAEARPMVGLGAMLGDPTTLTMKLRLSEHQSVQLNAGWGYIDSPATRLAVTGDYLLHVIPFEPGAASVWSLSPYLGIGALFGLHSTPFPIAFGPRVPIGLSLLAGETPLELFAEIGIGELLAPRLTPMIQGGLGARYYAF